MTRQSGSQTTAEITVRNSITQGLTHLGWGPSAFAAEVARVQEAQMNLMNVIDDYRQGIIHVPDDNADRRAVRLTSKQHMSVH